MDTKPIQVNSHAFPRVSEKLIRILNDSITSRDEPFSRIVPLYNSTDFLNLFRRVIESLQNLSGHLCPFHLMKPCRSVIGLVWTESSELQVFGNSLPAHIMKKDSRNNDLFVACSFF
jgi:hypothetical protein